MIKDRETKKRVWRDLYKTLNGGCVDLCPKKISDYWSCCNCVEEFGFIDGYGSTDETGVGGLRDIHHWIHSKFFFNIAMGDCPCESEANPDEIMLHLKQITGVWDEDD